MSADEDPLWFVSPELLKSFFYAEIDIVTQLLEDHQKFRNLLDAPEATVPERTRCFELLAHGRLVGMIDDKFAAWHAGSPFRDKDESNTLKLTYDLVAADAPPWALEMQQVVDRLPAHIYSSLPEPLRIGGYNPENIEQMQAIESAKKKLSNVEQLRALTKRVLDQQLQRLSRRWSAGIPTLQTQQSASKANRLKGTEGLVHRKDLSKYAQYMDNLTEKQRLAFALRFEYGLKLTEIALRMGIDRKTADEHIKAAQKKFEQSRSREKRRARGARKTPEF